MANARPSASFDDYLVKDSGFFADLTWSFMDGSKLFVNIVTQHVPWSSDPLSTIPLFDLREHIGIGTYDLCRCRSSLASCLIAMAGSGPL